MSQKKLRSLIVLGITLLISVGTVRAEGPGWTPNSTIKKLVVTADGGINILLSPQPTQCVSNSGYGSGFASVYPNHPGLSKIHADLLSAYLTGGLVAVYFSDNTCRISEIILGGW